MKAGKRFVVVIDEAQNLDDSVLETVRLLSNFETPRAKLMQIIMSGQPELADKLARPNLCAVAATHFDRRKAGNRCPHNTCTNICSIGCGSRIHGAHGCFCPTRNRRSSNAVKVFRAPINNLCFNALSLAYALGERQIERSLIEENRAT